MDAPPIAVAAEMLYEHTNEIKYRVFVEQLMSYIQNEVSDHGFIAAVNGKPWFFEYADTKINEGNAAFVLNGSMVSTLATVMLADFFDNEALKKLTEESTENYKEMMDEFLYRDNVWCYYMLNRKAVNQPHYVIFEIRLCDALFQTTGDSFYLKQASIRRDMLLRYYKCYISVDEQGQRFLTMMRGGAPHYYYNDMFATRLEMFDQEGKLIKTEVIGGRKVESAVIYSEIPENVTRVEWSIQRSLDNPMFCVLIGELSLKEGYNTDALENEAEVGLKVSGDGVLTGEEDIVLINDSGKASIFATFLEPEPNNPEAIFVIELDNASDFNGSMDMSIYDSYGVAYSRTLLPLSEGKQFVAFGLPGFVQSEEDLRDIFTLRLRIYTNTIPSGTEKRIRINHVYVFNNSWEYIQYFLLSDYSPSWRE